MEKPAAELLLGDRYALQADVPAPAAAAIVATRGERPWGDGSE